MAVFDPLARQTQDLGRQQARDAHPLERSGDRLVVGGENEEDCLALVATGRIGEGIHEALEAVADDQAEVRQKQRLPRRKERLGHVIARLGREVDEARPIGPAITPFVGLVEDGEVDLVFACPTFHRLDEETVHPVHGNTEPFCEPREGLRDQVGTDEHDTQLLPVDGAHQAIVDLARAERLGGGFPRLERKRRAEPGEGLCSVL